MLTSISIQFSAFLHAAFPSRATRHHRRCSLAKFNWIDERHTKTTHPLTLLSVRILIEITKLFSLHFQFLQTLRPVLRDAPFTTARWFQEICYLKLAQIETSTPKIHQNRWRLGLTSDPKGELTAPPDGMWGWPCTRIGSSASPESLLRPFSSHNLWKSLGA